MRLILLAFIATTFALASDYILYPKNDTIGLAIKEKYPNAINIFTKKEKELLKDLSIKSSMRLDLSDKSLENFKIMFPNTKIEKRSHAKFFNRYENYQWALKNKGELVQRWISDIDVQYVQGKKNEDINTPKKSETSKTIKVAVVDSGLDLSHPDLIGQIYEDIRECSSLKEYKDCLNTNNDRNFCHNKFSKIDHNKNGYPLDCNGWNITGKSNPKSEVTGSPDISDSNGHGTHVAGIIAAKNNSIGIKGVIQNVKILPIQVGLTSSSTFSDEIPTDNIAKGILYAIQSDAQIINLSLGWRINQDSLLMRELVSKAIERGILVVAAAGNDSHDETVYPCSYKGVICVASHDINGQLSSFSNYGAHVDIAAPGNTILSTYPLKLRSRSFTVDPDYEYMSGTSQATPFVSGALALLLNQGHSPQIAKAKLLNGARKKNSSHKWIRFGNLDIESALNAKESIVEIENKTPALINISKEKAFSFKIKTPVDATVSLHSNDLTFQKSKWSLQANPVSQEIRATILNNEINKKSYFIEVNINSLSFNKKYWLQVNPVMVISTKNKSSKIKKEKILTTDKFSPSIVKKFDNFYDNKNEYLAIKSKRGKLAIQAILKREDGYIQSRSVVLKEKNTLILSIHKVDIDQDNSPEYLIVRADLEDKNKKMIFNIFDNDFNITDIEITKGNVFKNIKTVMPGSFIWIKQNKRMIPTWISYGLDPDYIQTSPWEDEENFEKKYRVYQLLNTGLIDRPIMDEINPISFLYQSSKDRLDGKAYILTGNGTGYRKTHGLFTLDNNGFNFNTHINLKTYFNFTNAFGLPMVNTSMSNAFFSYQTIDGMQDVVSVEINEDEVKVTRSTLKSNDIYSPILRVLRYSRDGDAISQTSNKLIAHSGDNTIIRNSYTDAKRIKHYLFKKIMGVMLPQKETFNLSSHTFLLSDGVASEPAFLQTYAVDSCLEIGLEQSKEKEFVSYYCEESEEILKLQVSE